MYSRLKVSINKLAFLFGLNVDRVVEKKKLRIIFELLSVTDFNIEFLRIGSPNDGGYVVPNVLSNIDKCLSFGISDNCDLENELVHKGIEVYAVDGSIDRLPEGANNINFTKKYIGRDISEDFMPINTWLDKIVNPSDRIMLSIDIEESEWEVLLEITPSYLYQADLVVVEYHGFHLISQNSFYRKILSVLLKMSESFFVVNINFNETAPVFSAYGIGDFPSVIEITYLSKRYVNENNLEFGDAYRNNRISLNNTNNISGQKVSVKGSWRL